MFLPLPGVVSLDKAALEIRADEVFLDLLKCFTKEGRNVGERSATTYAPSLFAKEPEAKSAGLTKQQFEAAMRRHFKEGRIWKEPYGGPSRPNFRLAAK